MAKLSKEELKTRIASAVDRELVDARTFIETDIGELRARNTEYYNGEPFGNEEEGRSQVISRDVRDTVQALLPSLMRVFYGSEKVVEFNPKGPEDIQHAEQATDFITHVVLQQDNDGFRQFHSAIKDALVRKVGIFKWWWDDRVELSASEMTGVSEAQLVMLQEDDSIESVEATQTSDEGDPEKLFDVIVHRRRTTGRARFAAIPGEEFLIDRRATSIRDATLVAHRQMLTVSDLVAMGYDLDEIEAHVGSGNEIEGTSEYMARHQYGGTGTANDLSGDPMNRRVQYVEAYMRLQISEKRDDPAQLVKACGIGISGFDMLHYEPVDEIPFSALCPDPEPHAFFGSCPADQVTDIQLIKSAIWRGTLDSMVQSMFPRTEIVDGRVNMDDLLNSELGGVVRVDAPGMMREVKTSFIGSDTIPLLGYVDKMREDRTKQSQASQGLDADALQSTTKAAVSATITGAQAQIELIARIFAETGVKELFRGLLRLITRHQDRPRMVRLRGTFVEIDPRHWDAEMDVTVNVALGAGGPEEKIAVLSMLAQKQELVLSTLGKDNGLVGLKEYRETLAEMLKLTGWKDPARFLKEIGDEQPAPPQQPLDPAKALADAQREETQMKMAVEREKLALEERKMMMEDARERYRIEVDAQVKIAIAEAQHKVDIDEQGIQANIQAMTAQADAQARQYEADRDAEARKFEADAAARGQVEAAAAKPAPASGA